ncbi:hypothetical protein [Paenibacillus beijingensis]|uniref:Uracil-DNA glycosylase-like domain-containing protein n=1 Tax=Paenibacillus beijingensis TaxID=1126833 RepID=A0A0D5NGZ1_9BACL|nr:hypothetical protein [Paenibacillus beijingensis]AJY74639.1 hypothetical protein VN24_08700 [Paenibacillus beijingensis]
MHKWSLFEQFESAVRALPDKERYDRADLLVEPLLIHREGSLEMYYAPYNDCVQTGASVCIIGLTPGWAQMELGYRVFKQALREGRPVPEACMRAKTAARFAGPMRTNLLRMLQELELHQALGLPDCESLFEGGATGKLLHTTSALRYPVFAGGRNYSGSSPALLKTPCLCRFAEESVKAELLELERRPLIVPLGRTVEAVLRRLLQSDAAAVGPCLWGFPHPSGANGHRHRQFEQAKEEMMRTIRIWRQKYSPAKEKP